MRGASARGSTRATRRELSRRLEPLRVAHPLIEGAPKTKDARWVEPKLVCECAFTEWTAERLDAAPAAGWRCARTRRRSSACAKTAAPERPRTSMSKSRSRGRPRRGSRGGPRRTRTQAGQPRQGALPGRRDHQARDLGLLHGHRPGDAPASRRPPADPAALPRRHRGRGVVSAERAGQDALLRAARRHRPAPREQEAHRVRFARDAAVAREPGGADDSPVVQPRAADRDDARGDRSRAGPPGLHGARSGSGRRARGRIWSKWRWPSARCWTR